MQTLNGYLLMAAPHPDQPGHLFVHQGVALLHSPDCPCCFAQGLVPGYAEFGRQSSSKSNVLARFTPLGTDAVSKFLEEASFSLTMDVSEDVGGVNVGDYADLAGRQRSPIFSSSCNRSLYG